MVTPDRGTLGLKLYMYAFGDGARVPTVTEYRRVGVGTAPSLAVAAVQVAPGTNPSPSWHASQDGASSYRVSIGSSTVPVLVTLKESVGS